MTEAIDAIARHETDATAARDVLMELSGAPDRLSEIYTSLCRWTWRAMVERRLDTELRSWHRLILDVAARVSELEAAHPDARGRSRLTGQGVSERLRAFAELVRMSVEAAEASIPRELIARAHVAEILRALAEHADGYLERSELKEVCGLKDANLSRVLTLLDVNGLVEREPRGKKAAFRVTARGLEAAKLADRDARVEARATVRTQIIKNVPKEDLRKKVAQFFNPGLGTTARIEIKGGQRQAYGPCAHENLYTPPPVTIIVDPTASEMVREPADA